METTRGAATRTQNRWGRLFAMAMQLHGVVTHQLAIEVGLSPQAVRDRARAEGWTRLTRGAWLLPGAPDTHRARACAHLLLLGDRAAVSHASAGYLHALLPAPPDQPQLVVPADRHAKGRAGAQVRRSRTLTTGDVVELDGLRVTSVVRTLRDLAFGRTWEQVYDLVTDAEQRRLASLDELVAAAERLRHGPGGGRFLEVVQQRRADRSDSALERDTRDATRKAGYAPSAGPFPVRVRSGRILHLDVVFPVAWFAIECDGFGFHSDRRAFERDRQRWQQIQQAGFRLTWVTRRRLREDLDGLLQEVAEAHRLADPARPPAVPAR